MNKNIFHVLLLIVSTGVSAAQFSDDFNRESTSFVGPDQTEQIGPGWKTESSNGAWRIVNQQLVAKVPPPLPKPVLYNTAIETKVSADSGFKLSGVVIMKNAEKTGLAGLAFNYQNSGDQYVFRFSGSGMVQLLQKNSSVAIFSLIDAFQQTPGTPYRLTVLCMKPYEFTLTIQEADTGKVVFSKEVTDNKHTYENGYGGFYSSSGAAVFDDLTFEAVPIQSM